MNIDKICKWINELADKTPTNYGEYFFDDIRNYLDILESSNQEQSLRNICGNKYNELISCKSKKDVENWLNKISGEIIMKIDTENIIHEYFNSSK